MYKTPPGGGGGGGGLLPAQGLFVRPSAVLVSFFFFSFSFTAIYQNFMDFSSKGISIQLA